MLACSLRDSVHPAQLCNLCMHDSSHPVQSRSVLPSESVHPAHHAVTFKSGRTYDQHVHKPQVKSQVDHGAEPWSEMSLLYGVLTNYQP